MLSVWTSTQNYIKTHEGGENMEILNIPNPIGDRPRCATDTLSPPNVGGDTGCATFIIPPPCPIYDPRICEKPQP